MENVVEGRVFYKGSFEESSDLLDPDSPEEVPNLSDNIFNHQSPQ